jgi:hypothetical protein
MAEVPSVSGAVLTEQRKALDTLVGTPTLERALGSLSVADREAYLGVLAVSWVPLEVVERVLLAVAHEAGRDVASLHLEAARIGVERALRTVWRLLLRFTSDEALVSRTPSIYAKGFNVGRLVTQIPSPGRAVVRLCEWPVAHCPDYPLRGTAVGVETVLALSGRKAAKVEWERAPHGGVFRAVWKV